MPLLHPLGDVDDVIPSFNGGEMVIACVERLLDDRGMARIRVGGSRSGTCADNARLRVLHHHVFDTRAVIAMVREAGFSVGVPACRRPYHIICLAGLRELDDAALDDVLRRSPFRSDRSR